ncbi:MAG: hypothetical protein EBU23_16660, partial [Mycobacteriaceae bacterium]|nr:hypothetical protein [Mycobacteriaceae bacterium]
SEPFSLRKLSKEDSGGELLYQSDPIPFGKCTSRSYLCRPCLDGAAALQISGGSKTAFAPNAALPGYKPSEYYDEPETYTDDLFGGAIEFGFATLTPAEEHTPDGAAGCGVGTDGVSLAAFPGCGGDCPPSELTVEIEEQCQKLSYYDPYSQTMKEADCFNPTNFEGGSYTVTLVPEESQGCRLVYRYETDKYTSCADNQEHAELSITVVVDNSMPGEAACGCEGGRIEVAISGLTVRGTRSSIYTDDYMDMKITNAHGKPWVLVQVLSNGVSNGLRPLPDCHVVCGGFSAEREAAAGGVGRMLFRSDSPGTGNTPCDYAIDYESTGRPPYFSKITVSG